MKLWDDRYELAGTAKLSVSAYFMEGLVQVN